MKNIISIIRLLFAIIFILSIGVIGVTSYQINLLSNTKNYVNIGTDATPQYVLQDISEYSNVRWIAVYMLIVAIVVLVATFFLMSNLINSEEYIKIKKQIEFDIATKEYQKLDKKYKDILETKRDKIIVPKSPLSEIDEVLNKSPNKSDLFGDSKYTDIKSDLFDESEYKKYMANLEKQPILQQPILQQPILKQPILQQPILQQNNLPRYSGRDQINFDNLAGRHQPYNYNL